MAKLEIELSNGRTAYVEFHGLTEDDEVIARTRLLEDFETSYPIYVTHVEVLS